MNYTIFDTRGLLLHSYHRSQRKTIETVEGFIPSWQDGLAEFMDEYLKPVLKTCAPRQILACFDGGNNARRRMYIGYKAKRSQRDRDENPVKSEQIKLLLENGRRLLAYLGCRTLHVPGEEADDLIALLVDKIEADGFTIYTRDADLLQLASEKIFVSRMGKLYGLTEFAEQTFDGVPFDLVVLMKAIVGDSSDEYPGVAGCGPKFFENLMETHGVAGLRQIRDWVVSGERSSMGVGECKLLNKLADNWPDLIKFYQVAKVDGAHCYGSLNNQRKQPEWYVRVPNRQKVAGILQAIEPVPAEWEAFFPSERLMDGNMAGYFEQVAADILASPIVSYDYEASDKTQHGPFREYDKNYVDVLSQELTSISINYGANLERTIYVPFDHAQTANLTKEWAIWLLSVLSAVQPRAVVQNAAFELAVTAQNLGIPLKAQFDTAIMAMYVDENEENGLKAMSQAWLNYKQATYKEVTQGRMMCELTAQEALSYGCDDSLVTGHLFDVFRHIMQMEGSWAFYAANEVDWAVDSTHYFLDGTDIDFGLLDEKYQDAKHRVKAGLEAMHAGLAEHCNAKQTQESAHAAATLLLNEWWVMEKAKAEKRPETLQAAYQALWEKAWNGCFYTPPSRRVEIKFAPTAAQLTAVALMIDKALPRISKVSAPGIEDWEAEAVSALDVAKKSRPVDPLAREFVDRLYAARKNLSAGKRQGSGYADLESFCLSVLEERGNHKAILSGDQLNTNSTVQMQTLLYGKLGLPLRRRSKVAYGSTRKKMGVQGGPATGLKAIQAAFVHDVAGEDWRKPVLEAYLDVAKVSQEISLYYESYPLLVHPQDGRIHPQIRNCGTVTRRPSGTAPNVLQVAKGPLRTVFRAGDYGDGDRVYVACDFASQELVITACESKDPVMLDAFMSTPRKDLHSLTATGFAHTLLPRLGVAVEGPLDYDTFVAWRHHENKEINKAVNQIRNKYGKSANFLIAYLGGPNTLAENLLMPLEEAKDIMNSVFALYKRMQPWQQETTDFALKHGYTLTAYGNKRHAPADLWSSEKGLASRAARQAVNATVQGTAADILKIVLTEMSRREMRQRYRLKALKPVYDEISASVPIDLVVPYTQELVEIMSITPPGYPVGMAVDLSIGRTWGSVEEVGGTDVASVEKILAKL